MGQKESVVFTIERYLYLEASAEHRNEYERGKIYAMSGGTINHGIIGSNINSALNNGISDADLDCTSINGDVRIFIEESQSFVYPDATVVCGAIETAEVDKHSIINPMLVVEVLSKSTERYDRGDKFHKYCSLPSFKEYVLIDQYKAVIDVLYRESDKYWKMSTCIGLDKSIYLHTLDFEIPLRTIYRNVKDLKDPNFKLAL
ncbi:MAG: Uma2 family endonuclease [Bacteroidota bacterium]